jgi:hypothetical protein
MILSLRKYARFGMNTHDISIMTWQPFVPTFVVIKLIVDIVWFD